MLKDRLDSLLAPPLANNKHGAATAPQHRQHLATAVPLVEAMRTDADCSEADCSAKNATDFRAFTAALNEQLGVEDKLQVVKAMWAVACTDGQLTAQENHMLWRDADLLHVPHGACINAELRAKAVAGQA